MRSSNVIPVTALPNEVNGSQSPLWWSMVLLIVIEVMAFGALVSSYFYLRFYAPDWPLAGIERPALLLPTINTVILLASMVPIYWADRGMRQGNLRRLILGFAAAVLVAIVFLVLLVIEYRGLNYTWATNAYGSIVWVIVGFYAMHVASAIIMVLAVGALAWTGYFTARRRSGVEVACLFWYFVALVWIPLYLTVYMSPYLL